MIAELIGAAFIAFIEAIASEGLVEVDGDLWWRTTSGRCVRITVPEGSQFNRVRIAGTEEA